MIESLCVIEAVRVVLRVIVCDRVTDCVIDRDTVLVRVIDCETVLVSEAVIVVLADMVLVGVIV